jgi:hypothetical protein
MMNEQDELEFDDINEIKNAFETILGSPVEIEYTSELVKEKELFVSIVEDLLSLTTQNDLVYSSTGIDINSIVDPYLGAIEKLFVLHFGVEAFDIIVWFLTKTNSPGGTKTKLEDSDGNLYKIDTPEELWDFLTKRFFSE